MESRVGMEHLRKVGWTKCLNICNDLEDIEYIIKTSFPKWERGLWLENNTFIMCLREMMRLVHFSPEW